MKTNSFSRLARLFVACMSFAALAFIASCKKDEEPPVIIPPTILGTQEWSTKNLSVASYSDGTPIPHVTDSIEWANLTTGAWCWYNNDSATYAAVYGRLYNWFAVAGIYDEASQANPALRKKLAPSGWHVPSDEEWSTLINFLDPPTEKDTPSIAGGMMKTTGTIEESTGLWYSPNTGATNSSGFSGVPAGLRYREGDFDDLGIIGYFWSSSEDNTDQAWIRELDHFYAGAFRGLGYKRSGYSVRCLRD